MTGVREEDGCRANIDEGERSWVVASLPYSGAQWKFAHWYHHAQEPVVTRSSSDECDA